ANWDLLPITLTSRCIVPCSVWCCTINFLSGVKCAIWYRLSTGFLITSGNGRKGTDGRALCGPLRELAGNPLALPVDAFRWILRGPRNGVGRYVTPFG